AALQRHPPEHHHDGHRPLPARDGDRHAHRGGALVPLDRRPAARRELGNDHPGRRRPDPHSAGGCARARARDRVDRAGAQRPRRRDPRRARPAREGQRAALMARFVLRRFAAALLVMFAISVLVFVIFFMTPGVDPAARIAGRNADQQTLREVRKDFGLDQPRPVQYVLLMKKLFITRNLTSYVNRGSEVIPQVWEAAPVTFSLVLGASVIWVVFAI